MKVSKQTRTLHKKDLATCKKAASKVWDAGLIEEIINLSWTPKSLQDLAKRDRATEKETALLVDLHNAAKLEFSTFVVNRL